MRMFIGLLVVLFGIGAISILAKTLKQDAPVEGSLFACVGRLGNARLVVGSHEYSFSDDEMADFYDVLGARIEILPDGSEWDVPLDVHKIAYFYADREDNGQEMEAWIYRSPTHPVFLYWFVFRAKITRENKEWAKHPCNPVRVVTMDMPAFWAGYGSILDEISLEREGLSIEDRY